MPDASSDVPPSLYPTVLTVWKTYFSRASVRSAHNGHHHVQDQNLHSLRPDDADEGFFLAYLLIRHVLQLHPQIRVSAETQLSGIHPEASPRWSAQSHADRQNQSALPALQG